MKSPHHLIGALFSGLLLGLLGCAATPSSPAPEPRSAQLATPLEDSTVIPLGDSPGRGAPDAWAQVVFFADLSDPFSGRLAMHLDEALSELPPGTARLVFKHFPAADHPQALLAHRAALSAHNQHTFWAYQERLFDAPYLFTRPPDALRSDLIALASDLGLDTDQFAADLDDPTLLQVIEADLELGRRLDVRTAPAAFINGGYIAGVQPPELYRDAILSIKTILHDAVQAGEMQRLEVYWRSVDTLLAHTRQGQSRAPKRPPQFLAIPIDDGRPATAPLATSHLQIAFFLSLGAPTSLQMLHNLLTATQGLENRVRITFFHLPHTLDPPSLLAHHALDAAHQRNQLLPFLHALTAEHMEHLPTIIDRLDLPPLSEDELFARIDPDLEAALSFSVLGTPTLFLNGHRLEGVHSPADLRARIDLELTRAQPLIDAGLLGRELYDALLLDAAPGNQADSTSTDPNTP